MMATKARWIDEVLDHMDGKHGTFKGRRYRKGKNRCKFCGAPLNTPDFKHTILTSPWYMTGPFAWWLPAEKSNRKEP